MIWYTAHIIESIEFKAESKKCIVYENMIMIHAADGDEAWEKAEAYGKTITDSDLYWDDQEATQRYIGIRKIVAISNSHSAGNSLDQFAEVTYQQYELADKNDLKKLIDGEEISIRLCE
jgi:hypothetical protein